MTGEPEPEGWPIEMVKSFWAQDAEVGVIDVGELPKSNVIGAARAEPFVKNDAETTVNAQS